MKPLSQVLGLCIEELPQFRRKKDAFLEIVSQLKHQYDNKIIDATKYREREQKMRDVEVKRMFFDKYIQAAERLKNQQRDIRTMFGF